MFQIILTILYIIKSLWSNKNLLLSRKHCYV